jgi:hypothetical protein
MANLLIGSSNLARFYKYDSFKDFKQYQMMKCTTMDSFTALMMEVEEGKNNIIVSVLENIIVDHANKASTDDNRDKLIKDSIKAAMGLIEITANRHPDSKFCIVMPLKRPAIKWFEEKNKLIEDEIRKGVSGLKAFNVTRLKCVCPSLQQFEADEIHLTSDSGFIFVEEILKSAEEVFNAVEVNEESSDRDEQAHKGPPTEVSKLVATLKRRFEADNMMFARLREEIDSTANKSREDRVVVTGITFKDLLPMEFRQRIEKLKELAAEIFQAIKPGFKGRILYASQGRNEQSLPMVEVKLNKVEHAVAIRKAFAEKRKKGGMNGCLEKVFLSNSINVGTRVRIEILKAVAKRISNDKEFAFVSSFISRPVMQIKPRSGKDSKPTRSYTFIDAIKQFGDQLRKNDLQESYAKAGKAFAGQLEQNFVVLKEADAESAMSNFHKARIQRGKGRGGASSGRGGGHGGGLSSDPVRGVKRSGDVGETSAAKK